MGPPDALRAQEDDRDGTPCLNCGTPLVGHYCHECGQQAHLHNKLKHLLHEFIEGIAHFDGRLWRTLPILALNPGRLSRAWIDGKRVRYVAPLHVFLFAVFLLFTIPTLTGAKPGLDMKLDGVEAPRTPEARKAFIEMKSRDLGDAPEWARKLIPYLASKSEHSDYYGLKFQSLLYKLSFLMAPIAMAILSLLLLYKRRFTLYDHGVVALYGLGVLALLWAIGDLLAGPLAMVWYGLLVFIVPIHALRHLRTAYGLSWLETVGIGVVMGVLTLLSLALFIVGVLALGFAG